MHGCSSQRRSLLRDLQGVVSTGRSRSHFRELSKSSSSPSAPLSICIFYLCCLPFFLLSLPFLLFLLFFLLSSTEQELNKTYEHKFAITRKTQSPEMSCVSPNPGFDTDLLYFIDNFNMYIIEFSFVLLVLHVVISIFLDNPPNCDS